MLEIRRIECCPSVVLGLGADPQSLVQSAVSQLMTRLEYITLIFAWPSEIVYEKN
jgi:hypothetical protein